MTKLRIRGVTCGHCLASVTKALQEVPGVNRIVNVNLDPGEAIIEGAPETQALINAVQKEGYQAEVIT